MEDIADDASETILGENNNNNNNHHHHHHDHDHDRTWMRGVNIGGWLLAERFITPYLFAVNSCHLRGDLCWYEGQIGKPENATICDPLHCSPVLLFENTIGNADFHPRNDVQYMDYPKDEYTLGQTFLQHSTEEIGQRYMERHWDTFVTHDDVKRLAEAGVTHFRVPLSFWIRGFELSPTEPYLYSPAAWKYFTRFARWCLEEGIEIWADLHGAPGSENGFDNSGHYLGYSTCEGWSGYAKHVERTVNILTDLLYAMAADEFPTEAITGMGLLNEPFLDCDTNVLRGYYQQGLQLVRDILGDDIQVFIGDGFQAWKFNDGFWQDEPNTLLDSHPYHVFFEKGRAFTPRQHIAYVCRHNTQDIEGCCYEDHPNNTIPTTVGMKRMVGEWSGAYDQLPTALAPMVMKYIAKYGEAPFLNRTLSRERIDFLTHFCQAQMVSYETLERGVSKGWFFWNFQMEGGVFAEWDFLRGLNEGWIPNPLPSPEVASQALYGNCYNIYDQTNDDYNLVVDEYPDPRTLDWNLYQGWDATDDFVLDDPLAPRPDYKGQYQHDRIHDFVLVTLALMASLVGVVLYHRYKKSSTETARRKQDYEELK